MQTRTTAPPRTTLTIRAAARALDVSWVTFYKWIDLGLVRLVETGPGGRFRIRRVPVSEVERLRRAS